VPSEKEIGSGHWLCTLAVDDVQEKDNNLSFVHVSFRPLKRGRPNDVVNGLAVTRLYRQVSLNDSDDSIGAAEYSRKGLYADGIIRVKLK